MLSGSGKNEKYMRKRTLALVLFLGGWFSAMLAQTVLPLDSCRALALRNNKTVAIAQARQDKATYTRRAAQTNFLPKVSVVAGYVRTGDELSLLNNEQKHNLTTMGDKVTGGFGALAQGMVAKYPDLLPLFQDISGPMQQFGASLNGLGQGVVDAFRTDNRNMAAGAVMLTQPLYMGGKIRAYNRITHYAEEVAGHQLRADRQQVVLDTDAAYWQVVSLSGKRRLAVSYRDMLQRLEDDVKKMVAEGVATKANELSVSVKLNEAEMTLVRVDDGLQLSRMLLCQLCGLPLDMDLRTADELLEDIPLEADAIDADMATAFELRPELKQLRLASDIYGEKVKVERSAFLPQLSLMGGYGMTNPSLSNGFENRFRGTWSVGVMLKVPIWNWGEGIYKVRAAKADALVAAYQEEDVREKIELQVTQSAFRAGEAERKLKFSLKNRDKAEENLRMANAGFKEGVVPAGDVLAAQTAWMQAQSDKIDAQIEVKMSRTTLRKALGTL